MKILYTDTFEIPLPPRHRFPIEKYARLRNRVAEATAANGVSLGLPGAASDLELSRVHDPVYMRRVEEGVLTPDETRRLGFPLSTALVERARRSCGATIEACRGALRDGTGVYLGGGTHHAFRDRGEGFCVYNDSVVAARVLQTEGLVERVLIVDCDVHQGNGTAAITRDDPTIVTFSLHADLNYPAKKETSDLDIALADGARDAAYLDALRWGLTRLRIWGRPDLMIYLAGADPFEGDRLGRLALTKQGLAERDRRVLQFCADVPLVVTMAGGYARDIDDTVDIHLETVRQAVGRVSSAVASE